MRYKLYDTKPLIPLLIAESRGLPGMKNDVVNLINVARSGYVAPLDALPNGDVVAGADGNGCWTKVDGIWVGYPNFGSTTEVALQLVTSGGGVVLITGGVILNPPTTITPTV